MGSAVVLLKKALLFSSFILLLLSIFSPPYFVFSWSNKELFLLTFSSFSVKQN